MVGRDRELGHLLDRWEEVQDGRGQVVLVSGDPGIGKSRLLRALRDKLADAPHLWLDMQCSPFTSGSPSSRSSTSSRPGRGGAAKSPAEASQLLVRGLEAMPEIPGEKIIPPLRCSGRSERYPLPQTSAEEQRNRTLAALVQIHHTLSAQQPVVLVAEDLHWSDASTLEYLGRLVEQAPTSRRLLVLTFRPEFRAPWAQSHVSEVRLRRSPSLDPRDDHERGGWASAGARARGARGAVGRGAALRRGARERRGELGVDPQQGGRYELRGASRISRSRRRSRTR